MQYYKFIFFYFIFILAHRDLNFKFHPLHLFDNHVSYRGDLLKCMYMLFFFLEVYN
jgi:hypothetical protein